MAQEFTKEDFLENYGIVTKDDIKQDYKNLNYISWATAWRMANEKDPECNYEIIESVDANGVKHLVWEDVNSSFTVRTKFTFKKKTVPMQLAIMDNKHQAVKKENLNGNYISNSIMRCLTKNISMFGIGLNLYEGEDIPQESEHMSEITKKKKEAKKTAKEKLTDLCQEKIVSGISRDKIIEILKQYEPKGIIKNMTEADAKKALGLIEKIK